MRACNAARLGGPVFNAAVGLPWAPQARHLYLHYLECTDCSCCVFYCFYCTVDKLLGKVVPVGNQDAGAVQADISAAC